jgi:hypothetical protein
MEVLESWLARQTSKNTRLFFSISLDLVLNSHATDFKEHFICCQKVRKELWAIQFEIAYYKPINWFLHIVYNIRMTDL